MNIKEHLNRLKESQAVVVKQLIHNQNMLKVIEPHIQSICKKKLDDVFGIRTLVGLSGGFLLEEWEPKVFVYPFQKDGKTFVQINGKWTWYDEAYIYTDVYSHKILDSQDFPFVPAELEKTCERLGEELGLNIRIIRFKTKKVDRPSTEDDLKETYPGLEVISSRRIDSIGWDIPDYYAIVSIDGETHLFYSSNGHGMGYDHHIEPGGDFTSFFEFISDKVIDLGDGTCFVSDQLHTIKNLLKNKNP